MNRIAKNLPVVIAAGVLSFPGGIAAAQEPQPHFSRQQDAATQPESPESEPDKCWQAQQPESTAVVYNRADTEAAKLVIKATVGAVGYEIDQGVDEVGPETYVTIAGLRNAMIWHEDSTATEIGTIVYVGGEEAFADEAAHYIAGAIDDNDADGDGTVCASNESPDSFRVEDPNNPTRVGTHTAAEAYALGDTSVLTPIHFLLTD